MFLPALGIHDHGDKVRRSCRQTGYASGGSQLQIPSTGSTSHLHRGQIDGGGRPISSSIFGSHSAEQQPRRPSAKTGRTPGILARIRRRSAVFSPDGQQFLISICPRRTWACGLQQRNGMPSLVYGSMLSRKAKHFLDNFASECIFITAQPSY